MDCQWIQYLHLVGFLRASFWPPDEICLIGRYGGIGRALFKWRPEPTQHMQKALSQMNLQLHHVLSDIMGVSGMAILDANLAGERDANQARRLVQSACSQLP
jgi:hypothetical protein